MLLPSVVCSLLLLCNLSVTDAVFGSKKVKRVKPGQQYEEHSNVFVAVNKVG